MKGDHDRERYESAREKDAEGGKGVSCLLL